MNRIQVNLGQGEKPRSDAGRTITLFLSLYLLVLAFFILLVSISSFEDVKSKALMDSLSSTFASVLPPRMDLTTFNATTGEFLAADEFQRQVTGLFSTVVGVEKVEAIQPGRLMRVELEGDSLFEFESDQVREAQKGFMDRLVAALSSNPPGLRFELEFVVPAMWTEGQTLPTDESLPIRRAGAFAREMLARGAPPGSVSIGLRGSEATSVEIWFHIRAQAENRILFEEFPAIKAELTPRPEDDNAQPATAPVTLQPLNTEPVDDGVVVLPIIPAEGPENQSAPQGQAPISLQPNAPSAEAAQ